MELEDMRSRLAPYGALRKKYAALAKQKKHYAMKVEILENLRPVVAELKQSNAKLEAMNQEQASKISTLEKQNKSLSNELNTIKEDRDNTEFTLREEIVAARASYEKKESSFKTELKKIHKNENKENDNAQMHAGTVSKLQAKIIAIRSQRDSFRKQLKTCTDLLCSIDKTI